MDIRILQGSEGAKIAQGAVVIIDVFRAFTLESVVLANGVDTIIPVDTVEQANRLRKQNPDVILIGERNGRKLEGFDYGNSPSSIASIDFSKRTVVHTTSAGTLGLKLARQAKTLYAGSLTTATALAKVLSNEPQVDLVCMGWNGIRPTEEDTLCAMYIQSILEGNPIQDIELLAADLATTEGKKFFDPAQQDVFPKEDFGICIAVDRYDFAMQVKRVTGGFQTIKVNV